MENNQEIVKNSLKIIEPIKVDIKTFQNEQEFEDYYNLNKKALDESTTTKLNRMFKIPGYRITRVKNELCLKKDYNKKVEPSENDIRNEIEELKKEIQNIKDILIDKSHITKINVKLAKCEKIINQHSEALNQLIS